MAARVSPSSWHPNHLCYTYVSVIVLVRAVHTFKYILTSVTQCTCRCVPVLHSVCVSVSSRHPNHPPWFHLVGAWILTLADRKSCKSEKNIKGIYLLQDYIVCTIWRASSLCDYSRFQLVCMCNHIYCRIAASVHCESKCGSSACFDVKIRAHN